MSKGSKYRPIQNKEQFESNWDLIFQKLPPVCVSTNKEDTEKEDNEDNE